MSVSIVEGPRSAVPSLPPLCRAGAMGVAGVAFELWTDEPGTVSRFLVSHGHFHAGRPGGARLRVEILTGGAHRSVPRIRFLDLSTEAMGGLIERGPDGRFAPSLARASEGAGRYRDRLLGLDPAVALTAEGCDVLEPGMLGPYLEMLLLNAALDRAPQLIAAHAGVIARGGRAAMLCGDGGAGKTTLTLALLRAGCAYLSDEVALLDPRSGTVWAYPRFPGIRPGTRRLLPGFDFGPGAFEDVSLTGERKRYVDPASFGPGGVALEARLEHVWFLRGFAPTPRISDVEPWEAAKRLARSLRHAPATPMERLWTAMDLLRRCRVQEVVAGHPESTAAALIRLLDDEERNPKDGDPA